MMKIRALSANDADAFKALRLEAVQDAPLSFSPSTEEIDSMSAEYCRAQLNAFEYRTVYGAWSRNQLIAIIGVSRDPAKKLRHRANLWGVYTKPPYRGQGVARALLEAVLEALRASGDINTVTLSVNVENMAAKRLYGSAGFVSFGVQRNAMLVDGLPVHEEHMLLELVRRPALQRVA
ncbi:MAG: GNAT family N-acetyltransferase [Pseudomonadota bacterium]